ncbi:hypothetical protein HD806DRAFT_531682 [Xylariaceae sp. AK1471]|nr:hypothetical protein HD806DRAFT_531682 [Xylariaceae sp. AK1471]
MVAASFLTTEAERSATSTPRVSTFFTNAMDSWMPFLTGSKVNPKKLRSLSMLILDHKSKHSKWYRIKTRMLSLGKGDGSSCVVLHPRSVASVLGDLGIPPWSSAVYSNFIKFRGETWFGCQELWAKVEPASVIRAETDSFRSGGELMLPGWGKTFKVSEMNALPAEYVHNDQLSRIWQFSPKCYTLDPGAIIYFDNGVRHLEETEIVRFQPGVGRNARGTSLKADTGLVLLSIVDGGKFWRVGLVDKWISKLLSK